MLTIATVSWNLEMVEQGKIRSDYWYMWLFGWWYPHYPIGTVVQPWNVLFHGLSFKILKHIITPTART